EVRRLSLPLTRWNRLGEGIAFDLEGQQMAFVDNEYTVRLCDLRTGKNIRTFGKDNSTVCVHISPDGKTLVSGANGGSFEVWDINTGKSLNWFLTEKHQFIWGVVGSRGGTFLASLGEWGGVCLWDLKKGEQIWCSTPGKEHYTFSAVF